ncbi:MAG TPA: hypothetical protein ENN68_04360 [Methanomicrobia archaeon]|nr:hypothetical protein [Methanomicrobia archaeon]
MNLKTIGSALAIVLLATILCSAVAVLADPGEEILFLGTITDGPHALPGAKWCMVTVDQVISGPYPNCTEVKVRLYISPPFPWGYFETTLSAGDRVEVFGKYSEECTVSLNGNADYYITKYLRPQVPAINTPGLLVLVVMLAALIILGIQRREKR